MIKDFFAANEFLIVNGYEFIHDLSYPLLQLQCVVHCW